MDAITERGAGEFDRIIVENVPLIDVRAPAEFASGAIPGASNLPILDDEQRHLVGRCYRENGPEKAVELGHRLVSGETKERRVNRWHAFVKEFPDATLYCSRGGMRSKIACQWISESCGTSVARLRGGYKTFRSYLIDHLSPAWLRCRPIILGGRTGAGKTKLLGKLDNAIDLEKIAHHRGSSFGRFITPQPGQADFENRLARALIKHENKGFSHLILEDEGRHIGKRFLPKALAHYFTSGDLVILRTPLLERVQNTFEEYVVAAQAEYETTYGQSDGLERWFGAMILNMERIAKRFGAAGHRQVRKLLEQAHAEQLQSGSAELHREWVTLLLVDYYDPMYDYQIGKKNGSIVFSGNADDVLRYLQGKRQ